MSAIKAILIALILALMLWAFRNRQRVGMRAGARLLILVLTIAGITSVISPGITQYLADRVGVTRGTDLLLYGLLIVFTFTAGGLYFRFRELECRLVLIVRSSAIRDALLADGLPGSGGDAPGADETHGLDTPHAPGSR